MFDYLITGARIVDGTGNPWRSGGARRGTAIAALALPGRLNSADAATVIDDRSLVATLGFIDILSHSIVPFMRDGGSMHLPNDA